MAGPATPTSPKTTLHADLSGMPPSGRLGVYLRGRGRSGGSLRVNGAKSGTSYALTTALTPDIVELVFYDDAPALPYVWQTQAEAPTSIDVDIDIGPFEIDCIVPIVGVDR